LLRFDRRVQLVTAVAIVVLLGGSLAYYAKGGSTSTSTTSTSGIQSSVITISSSNPPSTHTESISSSSTSASTLQTIVSTTTVPCAPGAGSGASTAAPTTLPDYVPLFSTVHAMTMFVQQVVVDQYGRANSTTAVVNYRTTGTTQMDGGTAYVVELSVAVNETTYLSKNSTSNSGSAVAYFDPIGDLLMFSQPNLNTTGSGAIGLAAPYLDWYDYELISPSQLATYQNTSIQNTLNSTAVTLGPTAMNVTYASPRALPYAVSECGQTTVVDNVLFAFGTVPGTETPVITYYYSLGNNGVDSEAFGYKVVSVTH
jgi:hypothetical protein